MKKKLLTRKGTALRWSMIALILGGLAWMLLPWNPTPEAAHRQELGYRQAGEAEIVWETESPMGRKLLIALNEHAVSMGAYTRRGWFHWDSAGLDIVEREADRPFAAGEISEYVYSREPEETIDYFYIFGVVQDEAVTEIFIDFDAITGGHDQSVRLTESDWITTDSGERVFLWAVEPQVGNWARACAVTGILTDGTATETYQLMGIPRWE